MNGVVIAFDLYAKTSDRVLCDCWLCLSSKAVMQSEAFMVQNVFPAPITNPIFKLSTDEWETAQEMFHLKIDGGVRLFVIFYCNEYIKNICRFYALNNKIRSIRRVIREIDKVGGLIDVLDVVVASRRGDLQNLDCATADAKISQFSQDFELFCGVKVGGLINRVEHQNKDRISRECVAEAIEEPYRVYYGLERDVQCIKDSLSNMRFFLEKYINEGCESIRYQGDPYIDVLTIRLWLSFIRSGGIGKYSDDAYAYIAFFYRKMIDSVFHILDRNIYSSIRISEDGSNQNLVVMNRLKRATEHLSSEDICALDNIRLFSYPESVDAMSYQDALFILSLGRLI
jgi:hypothetical protein